MSQLPGTLKTKVSASNSLEAGEGGNLGSLGPENKTPERKVSEWKLRTILLLMGLSISLLLFEGVFRLFSPLLVAKPWRDLPRTYFLPEKSGPIGDRLISAKKEAGTYRVVVVGDSFTHSATLQIFDTFPKRLERYLNLNVTQPKVEVISYAKPGAATVHELGMVKRALEHFEPDLILLQITLNDPEPKPFRVTHSYQREDGKLKFDTGIFHYWKSLGFIMKRIYSSRLNAEYEDYYRQIFADEDNWKGFRGSLRNMAELTASHNTKFAAVIFPLFSYPFNEHYPFKDQHRMIAGELQKNGTPYLDLLSAYDNIPSERLQTIPHEDPHPSEVANRIAADEILAWLGANKLVPAETMPKNSVKSRPELKSFKLFLEGDSAQAD